MARLTHSAAFGSVVFRKIFGGRLREHDLGEVAVDDFQLRLALESEHDWIARFAVLRDGGMQLRQLLQAGQLIEHKPDRVLLFGWAQ